MPAHGLGPQNLSSDKHVDVCVDSDEDRGSTPLASTFFTKSTDLFIDFFDEVNFVEVLRSLDARLTVICPVNHEADSVEQLRILSDALHDRCAWVVVKNEAHSDVFKIYDRSKTRRHVVDASHAREITMPRMYDWLVTALNEHNTPVTVALTHLGFNLLDRQRLKNWQTRFYRQLYRAADLLLSDPHAAERFAA